MLYWHKILDLYHNILWLLCILILPQPIFVFGLMHYPKKTNNHFNCNNLEEMKDLKCLYN